MSGICVKNLTVGMVETNCCLVYNEETKQAVIVDPGDAADVIREECRKLELSPELILLTHGHFDHIMAAEELKKDQQSWLAEATKGARADSSKNGGGSMESVEYAAAMAEAARERVYALLDAYE